MKKYPGHMGHHRFCEWTHLIDAEPRWACHSDCITARLCDGRGIPYRDLRDYAKRLGEQNAILIDFTREILTWDNIEGATAFAAETLAKISTVEGLR